MAGDYYLLKYRCSNCLHGYMVRIPYKQEALSYLECPTCGMDTVSKTDKDVNWLCVYNLENGKLILAKVEP